MCNAHTSTAARPLLIIKNIHLTFSAHFVFLVLFFLVYVSPSLATPHTYIDPLYLACRFPSFSLLAGVGSLVGSIDPNPRVGMEEVLLIPNVARTRHH